MRTTGTRDRVVAGAVDTAAMTAVIAGVALSPSLNLRGIDFSPAGAVLGAVLAEAYACYELLKGASPGKVLVGLTIARLDGRPPRDGAPVYRWLMKHVPLHAVLLSTVWLWMQDADAAPDAVRATGLVAALAWAVSAVFVFGYFLIFDGMHQALHDVMTNTGVFATRALEAAHGSFEPLDVAGSDVHTDEQPASVRPEAPPSPPRRTAPANRSGPPTDRPDHAARPGEPLTPDPTHSRPTDDSGRSALRPARNP